MFRKKNLGSVTVFEDGDSPEAPEAFDDLGLNDLEPKDSSQDLQQMSGRELEALALGTATAGKESTARALRMANEAREIGVNTATNMQQQTTQLEKMSEDIEVVHDYLDKSEHIIDKMSKPRLVRMFQRKKPTGKGLNKVKVTRKEQDARVEMRKKGLESIEIDGMGSSKGELTLDDLDGDDRDKLFDGETITATSRRGRRGKKNKDVAPVETRQIKEDYSQYSEGVAEVMRKQDDDLDQISDALKDMQALAGAMNNELEYQDKLVTEVQDFTAETSRRTKENAKRINRIK